LFAATAFFQECQRFDVEQSVYPFFHFFPDKTGIFRHQFEIFFQKSFHRLDIINISTGSLFGKYGRICPTE
jgi:hypothetical protein